MNSLWNSDIVREGIRRASRKHIKDCWNWKGAAVNMANFSKLEDTMMHLLQQNRLSRSIKTRSHPFVMERVLEIILKRMNDPSKNPPLRIAAFGGSVTEGFRSRANTIGMDTSQMHNLGMCSWSCKLEHLLNEVIPLLLLGNNATTADVTNDKIVEVRNFAVSGTDSSIGVTLLEYDLLGADMTTTDVVISAFAANDMQAPVGLERDLIMLHMQRFLKVAKAARPCSDLPLLIQTADVIEESLSPIPGPEGIRQKLRYSNEMLETANWQAATSGIMALSYPDAVRDVVYRNPLDDILVEFGELHPGMSFHTGMAWMIAYGLLDGIMQSCDASSLANHGQPEPRAGILFPSLRDDLPANHVPGKWQEDMMAHEQQCSQNQTGPTKCAYQMIAHRLGAADADQVRRAIELVATNIDGWDGFGYPVRKPRRTWRASHQNATFTIQLADLKQPINRMLVLVSEKLLISVLDTLEPLLLPSCCMSSLGLKPLYPCVLQYLKSYGPDWEDVRLDLVVEGKLDKDSEEWIELKKVELSGSHNSKTSINYSEQIDLGSHLQVGSSVRATFTVVQGTQFQINGLALCHSYQPIESFM